MRVLRWGEGVPGGGGVAGEVQPAVQGGQERVRVRHSARGRGVVGARSWVRRSGRESGQEEGGTLAGCGMGIAGSWELRPDPVESRAGVQIGIDCGAGVRWPGGSGRAVGCVGC
eukprot:228680-Rhodomonas_salina.2